MSFTIETFIAQSRTYLLGANVQSQPDAQADLNEPANRPSPASGRRGERRSRAGKARRTARTTASAR